jgi:hypothetical protein
MARISIIIPALDDTEAIERTRLSLAPLRARGVEVIVASPASANRAAQLNAAAASAGGDVLLFLNADTALPPDADAMIAEGLRDATWQWGRFDVRIEGRSVLLPLVAFVMNWRSLATGIATGEQAIFVQREAFTAVGGFPDLPQLEDIELSKRLRRISRPLCLAAKATIPGGRWDAHGVLRTILRTWRLRLAYFFGASPAALAHRTGTGARDG